MCVLISSNIMIFFVACGKAYVIFLKETLFSIPHNTNRNLATSVCLFFGCCLVCWQEKNRQIINPVSTIHRLSCLFSKVKSKYDKNAIFFANRKSTKFAKNYLSRCIFALSRPGRKIGNGLSLSLSLSRTHTHTNPLSHNTHTLTLSLTLTFFSLLSPSPHTLSLSLPLPSSFSHHSLSLSVASSVHFFRVLP